MSTQSAGNKMNKLELLSPARNLESGLAALSHGADAVYIGAPRFGAREAVGNPVSDIGKLADAAHLYGAKLYVAFNTLLYNNELEEANRLIHELWNAGADALIIQDMGILEMGLPPIPLHASTQANNYTPEKVQFLEQVGFKRAVLARELSLEQIAAIRSQTTLELEAFVHGSLCVSLSGQCYMSHAIGGRSANRGACAQPCRKKYILTDNNGRLLSDDAHLLSLKDMNRAASLHEMADAGITSFKIEGRLKDIAYVKNITAYYRRQLDAIIEGCAKYAKASSGKVVYSFTPEPAKTFSRGATDYFLHGRSPDIALSETSKSMGEAVGAVIRVTQNYIEIKADKMLANNDGLAFINAKGESIGIKVNRVEGNRIFPDRMVNISPGTKLFRNYDHTFQRLLSQPSAERKIEVSLSLNEEPNGFSLTATDEDGHSLTLSFPNIEKIAANDAEKSRGNLERQLSKSGETSFRITKVETNGNEQYFFQAGILNTLRRETTEKLGQLRVAQPRLTAEPVRNEIPFPSEPYAFHHNVANDLALRFYRRHGIADPETTFEKLTNHSGYTLMTTKHCLKYQLNYCPRYGGKLPAGVTEPLWLNEGELRFRLDFDCRNCMMKVVNE